MKTYNLKPTKHPKLFRVVDREGNWEHYAFIETKGMPAIFLRGVTTILKNGYVKGPGLLKFLSDHTATERDEILKAAGEKGDKVHRAIDMMISLPDPITLGGKAYPIAEPIVQKLENGVGIFNKEAGDYEPISNEEWDALLAFSSFWNAHEPVVLKSEGSLYSIAGGYAGTADAIVILTKACEVKMCKCEDLIGKIGLFDWKTSKGIYPEYYAQSAAYANAENIGEYLPPEGKIDYIAILRLGTPHKTTGGYEFKAVTGEGLKGAFNLFNAAKSIADFEYTPFNPERDIEEIPDSLEIQVKHFDFEAAKKEAEEKAKEKAFVVIYPVKVEEVAKPKRKSKTNG